MNQIGTVKNDQESLVVIYDSATGKIAHIHQVFTQEGGKHPEQQIRENDALSNLKQAQPGFSGRSEVLHVSQENFNPRVTYRVDTAKRALVVATPERQSVF
jgi:hypothetical protein